MRIVVTRAPGRSGEFRRRLVEAGHEVSAIPLTEVRDSTPFPSPAGYDGVLFTSVAAVERAPRGVLWPRVGAVGPATAAALRARGIRVDVWGAAGGAALASAWGDPRGEHLLLPQAAEAHPALAARLREGGARVDAVAVYRTLPRTDLASGERAALAAADLLCFFAPSAVRAYLSLGLARRGRCWGVGPTTRQAILEGNLDPLDDLL